jgi:hypothetical protein
MYMYIYIYDIYMIYIYDIYIYHELSLILACLNTFVIKDRLTREKHNKFIIKVYMVELGL